MSTLMMNITKLLRDGLTVVTKRTTILIIFAWIMAFAIIRPWTKGIYETDVLTYYEYLPAAFIKNDLFKRELLKMTMGMSYAYAPFFFIGHAVAKIIDYPADGYSAPYQVSVFLGSLVYLLIGLYFLRKFLLNFFEDKIVKSGIVILFMGTNLFWYSTIGGLMPHMYLFSLSGLIMYLSLKWNHHANMLSSVALGILCGWITLIRPTLITFLLFPFLIGITGKESLVNKFRWAWKNSAYILLLSLAFLIPWIPQLLYWKQLSGHWIYYSYGKEFFYFSHPRILDGLIGFRKGWLIYSPLMVLAVIGFFFLRKYVNEFKIAVIVIILPSAYIMFSWWCWWYGGSFGQRAMIDFYGLFSIPLCAFIKQVSFQPMKRMMKIMITVLLLIVLNFFQTWQYGNYLIHYQSMTAKAYFMGFFKLHHTYEWFEALDDPIGSRAFNGLSDYYSMQEIKEIRPENTVRLTALHKKFLCMNERMELEASCVADDQRKPFHLHYIGDNKIALQYAETGKFVSADKDKNFQLIVDQNEAKEWETFEFNYLGENKFTLKAWNGKYVKRMADEPYTLMATGENVDSKAVFYLRIDER